MAGNDISMRNLLQLYLQAGRSTEENRKNSVDQVHSGKTQAIISKASFLIPVTLPSNYSPWAHEFNNVLRSWLADSALSR